MTGDSTPGPAPSVTDDEFIDLFEEAEDPVLSTAEVAEKVSLTRRTVLGRLDSLKAEGRLDGKQIGGRNKIWWIPE
jgi:predicted ArsR family transcriptional regulator